METDRMLREKETSLQVTNESVVAELEDTVARLQLELQASLQRQSSSSSNSNNNNNNSSSSSNARQMPDISAQQQHK